MKIAYVCHHKRPNYEYGWLSAMPVETVKFLTTEPPSTKPTNTKIEYCQVKYRLTGWENRFFSSTASRVFYYDFEKYLEDVDVVVVLEVFSSLSRQFVEYCRRVGKPVVVLVYELNADYPIYYLPRYRSNTRYVLANADLFVTVSNAAATHLEKLGAKTSKVMTVYPGVNTKLFQPDTTTRDPKAIAFIGLLEPHKGIDQVLEVYRRLVDEYPDQRLTVISKGSWQPQVQEMAASFPGITYLERVPNDQVPEFLNKHGLFILPARDTKRLGFRIGAEQFGFSVVEAMACGLGIITTKCGALPEIVTFNNVVCRQNDTDDLYRQTRELLRNPDRITQMGIDNRRIAVERYDMRTQAAALATALESLTTSHTTKGNS